MHFYGNLTNSKVKQQLVQRRFNQVKITQGAMGYVGFSRYYGLHTACHSFNVLY